MEEDQQDKEASNATSNQKQYGFENTLLLIQSVHSNYANMHHPKRRKVVWDDISNEMATQSVTVDSKGCSLKWRNLLRTYKTAKDTKACTGQGPSRFYFYEQMDDILGIYVMFSFSLDVSTLPGTRLHDREQPSTSQEVENINRTSPALLPSLHQRAAEPVPVVNNEDVPEVPVVQDAPAPAPVGNRARRRNVNTQYLLSRAEYYRERVLEIQELRKTSAKDDWNWQKGRWWP